MCFTPAVAHAGALGSRRIDMRSAVPTAERRHNAMHVMTVVSDRDGAVCNCPMPGPRPQPGHCLWSESPTPSRRHHTFDHTLDQSCAFTETSTHIRSHIRSHTRSHTRSSMAVSPTPSRGHHALDQAWPRGQFKPRSNQGWSHQEWSQRGWIGPRWLAG